MSAASSSESASTVAATDKAAAAAASAVQQQQQQQQSDGSSSASTSPVPVQLAQPGEVDGLGVESMAQAVRCLLARSVECANGDGGGAGAADDDADAAAEVDDVNVDAGNGGGGAVIPLPMRQEQREEIAKFLPAAREKYRYEHEIGRGGMGRVWAMTDADIGRVIAVKLIEDGLDAMPEEVGRFLQEAQITGQLEHPNIVPVYELGCTDAGQLYFTMKRVRGISLGEILFRLRHGDEAIVAEYDLATLLRILLKVCDAVAYAHDRSVVHRDLKPDNIMVGRFGEVLVMDWGVAKVLPAQSPPPGSQSQRVAVAERSTTTKRPAEREITDRFEPPPPMHNTGERALTLKGTVVGTPAYMAPEQGRGNVEGEQQQPVSRQSDVYSLGTILYEMLTHEPPYSGDDPVLVVRQLLDGPPLSVTDRIGKGVVPPELCAIVETAMAREPQQRYDSAEAFADDVLAYLEGRPVSVHRDSTLRSIRKWVRRQPAMAVGLCGIVLLALVTTLLGWATLSSQLAMAEQRSEAQRERHEQLEKKLQIERELNRRNRIDELRRKIRATNVETVPTGQLNQFVPICTQVLNLDPDHVATRIERGIAYWRVGQPDAARRDFDRALRNDPDSERANYYRGLIAEHQGAHAEALVYIDRAIAANPQEFTRHLIRLRLLAAVQRFATLQASLTELLVTFPRHTNRLIKLRVRYFEVERNGATDAEALLPQLGLVGDDEPVTALDQGYALLIDGRYEEAMEALRNADRRAFPISVLYGLACCQARLDSNPQAALRTLYHAWDSGLAQSPDPILEHDPDLDRMRDLPEFRQLTAEEE